MKTKKELLSWREAFKLNRRAFSLIYKRCPQIVVSRIVCTFWDALTPYVGIYLSALLIGELAGNKNADLLMKLVLITLCSSAAISLAAALLHKWRDTESAGWTGLYYNVMQVFCEKMMNMDFQDADNSQTHELYDTIRQNQQGGGWGITRVINHVEGILSAILSLLGGVTLTFTLFTSAVPENAGWYVVLNNPLFILAIVAIMLAITYISPTLSTKAGSYFAINSNLHNFSNRLFGYFGWLGYEKDFAGDIRMYRQDLISEKFHSNKESTFCSKGIFSKLGRGPIGLLNAASSAVSVLFTGVVYAFVCLKSLGGAFGIGSVTQYVASITKLSKSVSSLIEAAGGMRNNASFIRLAFEFLDIPNRMYQGSLTVEKRRDRDYEIEFKNVSFKYPGSETYALKNVSMKFLIGQRLAVVGMNGSGKTTFIKLLCRLYDPTEGEILLNGINIRKYNYQDYMSVFSVVFQDFQLFAYDIGENVAAKMDYDKEKAKNCLINAGFGERLQEMPDGLNTYLYKEFSKDGIDVSGGEAQKIALARALYKNAPFIILDEPTAALDPIAESQVYSNFDRLVEDKTALYISHRLSSCRFCDDIAVFDKGEIIQQGSHEKLVSDEKGKYYELWYAQAQYYT